MSCLEPNLISIKNHCNKFIKIEWSSVSLTPNRVEYLNKNNVSVYKIDNEHIMIKDGIENYQFHISEIGTPGGSIDVVMEELLKFVCSTESVSPFDTRVDSYGRTRISNCVSLFSTQFNHDKEPLLMSEKIVSDGNETTPTIIHFNDPSPGVRLTIFGSGIQEENFSKAVFQTKMYMPYQPESTLFATISFKIPPSSSTNIIQRIGYFDEHDDKAIGADVGGSGVYVYSKNGTYGFGMKTYDTTNNITKIDEVNKGAWNLDPLDIGGSSQIILQALHVTIVCFEINRNGGYIRCGFNLNGNITWAHRFVLEDDEHLFSHSLPLRAELGANFTATQTMSAGPREVEIYSMSAELCGTINPRSDHVYQVNPMTFSATDYQQCPKTVMVGSLAYRALVGIRLKASRCRRILYPSKIDIDIESRAVVKWSLVLNPTDYSPTWVSVNNTSSAEYAIDDKELTIGADSVVVSSGYLSGSSDINIERLFQSYGLHSSIDGITSDVLVLTIQAVRGVAKAYGTIEWVESR